MITRKIRIDISQFDANWKAIQNGTEDCYVIFRSKGSEELLQSQSMMRKAQKMLERKSIEYDNLREKINTLLSQRDEVSQELYDQEEKMEKDLDKRSREVINTVVGGLKDRFLFGVIYDDDLKKTRAMTKDDLDSFDNEILKHIQGRLSGEIEKKD